VEDYFEEEEEEQQQDQQEQEASTEVTTTNTSQQNHQPTCAVICVPLVATEGAQSAPDMMWASAQCLVVRNMAQKQICNISPSL